MSNGGFWYVRDAEDGGRGPVLEFTSKEWADLVAAVEAGSWPPWVTVLPDGGAEVRMPGNAVPLLAFDVVQMEAFADSVRGRQRDLLPT